MSPLLSFILPRIYLAMLFSLAAVCTVVTPVLAFEIRVRGEGKLYADVQGAGESIQVAGVLRDELGQALPQRNLKLLVTGDDAQNIISETIVTDMQGRFEFQKALKQGEYNVVLRFKETDHLDGASITKRVVLVPAIYKLYIQGPGLVVGTKQNASIRMRATANGVGAGTVLDVFVNDKLVDTTRLDHYGRGVYNVLKYLKPGGNKVRIVLPGTETRNTVQHTTNIRFANSAQIKATLSQGHVRLERGLVAKGSIEDDLGALSQGTVYVQFEPVGPEAKTSKLPERVKVKVDDDGEFNGFVGQQHLEDGQWRAVVEFEPPVGQRVSMTTDEIKLDRATSRWTLHILGLLTILIGVLVLAQRSSLSKLREWWLKLTYKPQPTEALNFDREEIVELNIVDDVPDDIEEPSLHGVAGFVWDTWRQTVVVDAIVEVWSLEELVFTTTTNEKGRFVLNDLPEGELMINVTGMGYAISKVKITMPHGGELRYIRIDLTAMALKIRKFYQLWVRQWRGEESWGKLTPRQIEEAMFEAVEDVASMTHDVQLRASWEVALASFIEQEQHVDGLSVERLMVLVTSLIEESYYSQRVYDEALWQLFVQITQKLEHHLPSKEIRP